MAHGMFEREVLKDAYRYAHRKLCDRVNVGDLKGRATPGLRVFIRRLQVASVTGRLPKEDE